MPGWNIADVFEVVARCGQSPGPVRPDRPRGRSPAVVWL